ncbi:hypothetical protein PanWU01x14_369680, partial [Parasponia andersonii]
TLIDDEVLGVKRWCRRGVGPKLKGASSTSPTAASSPRDPPVPNTKFVLARLVLGFHMSIQSFAAPDILLMPLLPTLLLRFWSEPPPLTSDT